MCGLKLLHLYVYCGCQESHPTWVCGLKQMEVFINQLLNVTPYVGVWIETACNMIRKTRCSVTPYVGVWIETSMAQYSAISKMVTPCVGIYGLEHCSLVGQVYGRTVSIRPLMYFSPGF